jgi:hypothetical protein
MPKGECETSGPVCDSEGQTLRNECLFLLNRCDEERTHNKTLAVMHRGGELISI